MHDLFQEYFYFNVEEINANDSKEYLIGSKQKWFDIAQNEYKRQSSGTPPLNYIFKSIFRNFPMIRTFSEVPFRVLIIKDADSLNMDLQHALRRTLERSTRTCRFCLICENLSKIIDPIRSRCVVFHFTPLKNSEISAVLRYISSTEAVSIQDDAISAIIHFGRSNMIRAINMLQTVAIVYEGQKIDVDSVQQLANQLILNKTQQMLELAIDKKFIPARNKLRELFLQYGLIGEQIIEYSNLILTKMPIPPEWKIIILELLGEYDLKMRKGDNEEIQLSAFLAKIGVLELNRDETNPLGA